MSANLETCTEMEALSNEEAAKKAIRHVLEQCHDRPEWGWYIGWGTQSFSLLTEALARLAGWDLAKCRKAYACPNPKKPASIDDEEAKTKKEVEAFLASHQIIGVLSDLSIPERLELLQEIDEKFCSFCGAQNIGRVGECSCHIGRSNRRIAEGIA